MASTTYLEESEILYPAKDKYGNLLCTSLIIFAFHILQSKIGLLITKLIC